MSSTIDRRRFMAGMGIGAGAIVLAACGDDEEPASSGSTTTLGDDEPTTTTTEGSTTTEGGGGGGDDLAIAQLAAGLEVLAVNTYQAAADAATQGALGEVPPAVVAYVTTALEHHQAHLDAWNEVITAAGEDEVTEPNAELDPMVQEQLGAATDVPAVAQLALMLEGVAAATYLDAVSMLTDEVAIEQAGSIFVVDRQHMSLLTYALGEYPVPDTFATTDESAA